MNRLAGLEREIRGQTICLAIIVGFLVLASLWWVKPVLLPFVLAVFIVTGLNPLLSGIQARFQTTRLVALAIAAIIGFFLIVVLWSIIWVSVAQLRDNAGRYEARFEAAVRYVEQTAEWLVALPTQLLPIDAEEAEQAEPDPETDATPPVDEDASAAPPAPRNVNGTSAQQRAVAPADMSRMVNDVLRWALEYIRDALIGIFNSGTMVIIFVFFLLLGSSEAAPKSELWQEIDRSIREYIVSKTVISFITGAIFGAVLWLFGVPLAMVFALLAFLFNFIPNIGPIIASLLPVPLILFDPDMSLWGMVGAITLSSTVQIISGLIEPRLMGGSLDMHPIVVLLALLFWGMIWGIVGMFLATPITAVMKILFSKFELTAPLADLLAGRFSSVRAKYEEFMDAAHQKMKDAPAPEPPATENPPPPPPPAPEVP